MRNGAYWIWCDIDGHGKRWHLAFTKRSDFGDDDEIVFPLDDFDDIAENYSDDPVQAVVAPKPLRPIPQTGRKRMTARNQLPKSCPKCGSSMDGGPIPEDIRHHYRAPFRWCRAIIINVIDGKERWQCPDCHHEWR